MFALLALASAVCYGAADFLGGLTSKKASTLAIVVVSQFAGLLLLFLMLPLLPAASPVRADYLWGGLAGLTGGIGVALLYRALAVGVMAVVAPTTAVCAVIIPVVAAVALGDRPGSVTIGGIALAIVAIALVSQSTHPDPTGDDAGQDRGAPIGFFTCALIWCGHRILLPGACADQQPGRLVAAGRREKRVGRSLRRDRALDLAVSSCAFRNPHNRCRRRRPGHDRESPLSGRDAFRASEHSRHAGVPISCKHRPACTCGIARAAEPTSMAGGDLRNGGRHNDRSLKI